MPSARLRSLLAAALLTCLSLGACAAVPTGVAASVSASSTPVSGLPTVAESALPAAAVRTLALIRSGGPFPYRQDGQVFRNREQILPMRATGYYHEYTVKDPDYADRGPWRVIRGDSGDLYWTADHYAHFQQVQEGS